MSNSKKKKKGFNVMKRSSMEVWIDKYGECHSKVKGSMTQNINNYNTMLIYLKQQATSMASSAAMILEGTPDVIIGTTQKDPRIRAKDSETRNPNYENRKGAST